MRCTCKKCRCREVVSPAKARLLVESGFAEWLVISKEPVDVKKICPLCLSEELLKKSCSLCGKTGEVVTTEFIYIKANDIVAVTTGSGESGMEVFRSVMSKQTPRVATIEYSHIIRAYVNQYKEDQDRIREYGKMSVEFINNLIVPFIPDPNDGRCLFPFGPDERSFPRTVRYE